MSISICQIHNIEKSITPLGRGYCKTCRKEYREANGDRIKNYLSNYRENHRDDNIGYQRQYREQNREELLLKKRLKYKEENPDSGKVSKYGKITEHPDYTVWMRMKDRCFNINNKNYESYGGRGITVCDRWKYSFDNFMDDMGPRPEPRHLYSIDRYPDKDGNYEPGNCRWATTKEQNNNRRPKFTVSRAISDHTLVIYKGKPITLKELSDITGIHLLAIKYRYSRRPIETNWIVHSDTANRFYEYKGHMYSLIELSLIARKKYEVMHGRLWKLGWSVERAMSEP